MRVRSPQRHIRITLFYHSLASCWNHGNAHFLRGITAELRARGHRVTVHEPADGWSRANLIAKQGTDALDRFDAAHPALRGVLYDPATLDLDAALDGVDLAIVHEWNEPDLVRRIGEHRARARARAYTLLFHDTHHRLVTDPSAIARFDLQHYDGVLAFGAVLRERYLALGLAARAWTWHEAADTRIFYPRTTDEPAAFPRGDLVWVGNWGDGERAKELREYLLGPVSRLRATRPAPLRGAHVYGVRYPKHAYYALLRAGLDFEGWLPNHEVPAVFARHRVTVHVPRRPYMEVLEGIPTIRVFEALACGIPLVSAPWRDSEGLFTPGEDFLLARDGAEMERLLRAVLTDDALAAALAAHGLATIRARHTCAHRVDELLAIVDELND